jgi:hypothetical protein
MNGKCPKCGRMVTPALERGPIGNPLVGPIISGYVAMCPTAGCNVILGVLPDPDSIVEAVLNKVSGEGEKSKEKSKSD